jgi:hypothetical protein
VKHSMNTFKTLITVGALLAISPAARAWDECDGVTCRLYVFDLGWVRATPEQFSHAAEIERLRSVALGDAPPGYCTNGEVAAHGTGKCTWLERDKLISIAQSLKSAAVNAANMLRENAAAHQRAVEARRQLCQLGDAASCAPSQLGPHSEGGGPQEGPSKEELDRRAASALASERARWGIVPNEAPPSR